MFDHSFIFYFLFFIFLLVFDHIWSFYDALRGSSRVILPWKSI